MALLTTIITDPTFFDQAHDELIELFVNSSNRPFFMQLSYLKAWWKHQGKGELRVITIRNEGELIGFLPLFSTDNAIRIVGAVDLSDYLDVLVKKGFETEVYGEIANTFLKLEVTEISLESLNQNSSTLNVGLEAFKAAGLTVTQTQQDVCPVITLPKTWEEYLARLDSDQQKKIKKLQRSIGEEDDITYRLLEKPEEIEEALPSFISLHKASSSDKSRFWTPEREAFFYEMTIAIAHKNQLKLYFLDVNDDPAATFLIFDFDHQFLLYNSGFNAYRYGHMGASNALLVHTINEAIKLGRTRFDFMRGDEAYKFHFGAEAESVFDVKLTF